MKGRKSIKQRARGVKRLENIDKLATQARVNTYRQQAYAAAQSGDTSLEYHRKIAKAEFRLSMVERKYYAAQKQMLATTSLKDLIK
jgi:hypothetical protein